MLVITADQVQSRDNDDLAGVALAELNRLYGDRLALPVDRNAGDEIQVIAPDGATALQIILTLAQREHWSIGVGAGEIRMPLPRTTREASGTAFIAARAAIDRAKKRRTRFAVEEAPRNAITGGHTSASEAEALIDLLLALRSRRTAEGWELFEHTVAGQTQVEAAHALGISPQAVSSRAKIAEIRTELASYDALARVLDDLDADRGSEQNR